MIEASSGALWEGSVVVIRFFKVLQFDALAKFGCDSGQIAGGLSCGYGQLTSWGPGFQRVRRRQNLDLEGWNSNAPEVQIGEAQAALESELHK